MANGGFVRDADALDGHDEYLHEAYVADRNELNEFNRVDAVDVHSIAPPGSIMPPTHRPPVLDTHSHTGLVLNANSYAMAM